MVTMPSAGIYVTIVRYKTKEVYEGVVKFIGTRSILTLHEVLFFLGNQNIKLDPYEKVWIRRGDKKNFINDPCNLARQLSWTDFNNCWIAISSERPASNEAFINFKNSLKTEAPSMTDIVADANKAYERDLEEQVRLWQEKREKKTERGVPKTVQLRKEVELVIIKKKRRARIAREKELEQTILDKKDPDC